jgi:uncharacterized membrane protein
MLTLTPLDFFALVWFGFCWFGYAWLNDRSAYGRRSLTRIMEDERRVWMRHMLDREVRIIDTQIMASLQNGTAFFTSTSLLALGGAFTLLNQSEALLRIFGDLALGVRASRSDIEVKVLLLCGLYGYSFFKFGWSYRVFNYAAILLGAVPQPPFADRAAAEAAANRSAEMQIIAAQHFNAGLRALFFSIGFLGWFLHPAVFMATTAFIMAVLAHRQYYSRARRVMARDGEG